MEDKVRVFEIAEEAGATSTEVIKKAAELSIVLKSPQSAVSFEQAEAIADFIMTGKSKLLPTAKPTITKKVVEETVESTNSEVVAEAAVETKTEEKKSSNKEKRGS